jgi:predicted AAA+ superfamily ATPase
MNLNETDKFAASPAFRIKISDGPEILPLFDLDPIRLTDLVGYDSAKEKLCRNTEAFLNGDYAHNCLLYGAAGTGKSSSIKGLLNEYHHRGLRIIELYKHQCHELVNIVEQIRYCSYKFIIYMDDLSFEDFEVEYKHLKSVIEGGLQRKPDNVLIYATSNRRHIIREKWSDRKESLNDLHKSETVQEKLSLAARFGIQIYFPAPERAEYHRIVKTLAGRRGIAIPEEELCLKADRYEMAYGGMSGRTARDFIVSLE